MQEKSCASVFCNPDSRRLPLHNSKCVTHLYTLRQAKVATMTPTAVRLNRKPSGCSTAAPLLVIARPASCMFTFLVITSCQGCRVRRLSWRTWSTKRKRKRPRAPMRTIGVCPRWHAISRTISHGGSCTETRCMRGANTFSNNLHLRARWARCPTTRGADDAIHMADAVVERAAPAANAPARWADIQRQAQRSRRRQQPPRLSPQRCKSLWLRPASTWATKPDATKPGGQAEARRLDKQVPTIVGSESCPTAARILCLCVRPLGLRFHGIAFSDDVPKCRCANST